MQIVLSLNDFLGKPLLPGGLAGINHYVILQYILHMERIYRVYKKKATSEFPKKSTLQFLSIKDFSTLGIEMLIDHITVLYCTCKITCKVSLNINA
jgi:hypothetical protein